MGLAEMFGLVSLESPTQPKLQALCSPENCGQ